jgi:broad specificity phosphatase PhoE
MSAAGVRDFERGYDEAGILDDDAPPHELRELARQASVFVASDMRRAIESAHRLLPDRQPEIQPLLRELVLEPPRWIPVLPIEAWDAISYAQWSARLALGLDHELMLRAEHAAKWLVERANAGGTVFVVTHGGFRRLVTKRLEARGWRCRNSRRSYANWSDWSLCR